jgi:CPA2 family monovalent cation:H+ antiporter-2
MEIWQVITEILLLLGVAFVFGFLAQWLKQSAVIGYLIAGGLLGPIMFSRHVVSGVAELGVSLLLFSIGLEFSFRRFKSMGSVALAGGTLQVLATMLVFGFLFSLRFPFRTALVLGAMVALSSTAVVLRILIDRTEIDSIRGRNALGILLVQDMAVVPLVLLVAMLSHGGDLGDIFIRIAQTVAAALGLVITFYLLFYHLIPRVLLTRGLFSNRELVVLLTIVMALGSTWLAHALGLSPALGAFLAGMLLAESPFAGQIRSDIGSLRTLFVTLFFTSIGMLANPGWFIAN